MKSGTTCEVCGNPLSQWSKSFTCSAACRKRKSRLGLDAGKNMIDARNSIRAVIQGLDLDVVSSRDTYEEYSELVEIVGKLRDAHNARFDREQAEERRLSEKQKA